MSEQTTTRVITINLKDLWEIFIRRFWIMVLVGVLTVGTIFTINKLTYKPKYTSTATIYIIQQNQPNSNLVYDDFNLALKLVNDCSHMIKSHSVLETVINNLDLDMSYRELYDNVKITNPTDTRILEVEVESSSPELSKEIVDEICTVGTKKITETMGFEQVNFFEEGIMNTTPSNRTSLIVYFIIGFMAVLLTYSIFFLIYIFDDRLRTDEDIKNQLNLSILGDIPFVDDNNKKHNNKLYRNKYYQRYYR